MEHISIALENCYGIKALKTELDYSESPAYAVYAPNGIMKSSLAETFQDAAKGVKSKDRIFTDREAKRSIRDENGDEIENGRILVIPSYDPTFEPTEKTSILLVSAELRKESERLEKQVEDAKSALFKALKTQSGSKKDFEAEISSAITRSTNKFEDAVLRVKREIEKQADAPLAGVKYDVIFNEKVKKALDDKDLMAAIEGYIGRYNELLAKSNYFRKGTFDYYNAGQIAKSLAQNGFFNAAHTVNLYGGGEPIEIKTQKDLEAIVAAEKDAILKDPELRSKFDAVQKQLDSNADLRTFYQYLQDNEAVLSRMNNIEQFREDVIKSYLKANEQEYKTLIETIESVEKRRAEIAEEARKQTTQWDIVIEKFNKRFFVPFELVAANKLAVMLGQERKPLLGFVYKDFTQKIDVDKDTLMKALSMGERKALYIINIMFEIESRIKDGTETLIVVDDIADSFDYNNKYAIIQYLKDISEDGLFKIIIMTHNFDFFRTVQSRFVPYGNCLMASKDKDGVALEKADGIKNVFANDWKKKFFTNARKKIASICFLRNIVEMTRGKKDDRYVELTSMLHIKADTDTMTVEKLDEIFNWVCGTKGKSDDPKQKVVDLIADEAAKCAQDNAPLKLENKIVLAVAIRLAAERYMIKKISDSAFVDSLKKDQTRKLVARFKADFPKEASAISVLDRVELITPENIHVNSFMYEPLLDMGDAPLRSLYADVQALK